MGSAFCGLKPGVHAHVDGETAYLARDGRLFRVPIALIGCIGDARNKTIAPDLEAFLCWYGTRDEARTSFEEQFIRTYGD